MNLAVQLKGLWLSNNFIEKVPDSILKCDGLETLHIDRNNIPSVPGELSQMSNLKDLVLSSKGGGKNEAGGGRETVVKRSKGRGLEIEILRLFKNIYL